MSKLIGALMATTMLLFGSMAHARTVTIAQSFDTETLWPNATTAAITINPGAAIVESLFWVDPKDSQLKPLLATSYEIESPTTVIVRLRPDVTFTNGEPMNADAAVQSINHVIDPKNAPAYTLFLSPFVKAEKVDDLTVRVHLKFPYAAIEQALAIIFITPPKYWNEVRRASASSRSEPAPSCSTAGPATPSS
jgi:peptide/nickel transport system substrate-binding protein